jgi:hypothetical protein
MFFNVLQHKMLHTKSQIIPAFRRCRLCVALYLRRGSRVIFELFDGGESFAPFRFIFLRQPALSDLDT